LKQDALDHLADALMEDITAAPGDDLLAEVREDFGDTCVLAVAFDQVLEGTEALAVQQSEEAAIGNLAYALSEDVAATATETLLREAAEDYGDRRALAVEFDSAVVGNAALPGATKRASAGASIAAEEWREALARSMQGSRLSKLLKAAFATLSERLAAPMRARIALGAFATALLLAILAPGLWFLEMSAERHVLEPARIAAVGEQTGQEEQARIAAQIAVLEEQKRQEEQARIAAQEEQKRREEQAGIAAFPAAEERIAAQHAAAGSVAQRVTGERRVALVVGNSNYNAANMSLSNPRNDAEDISAVLKELDFRVVTAINATRREMELKLQEFARLATNADSALFFYAGHAMQYQGRNFLMPIDAQLEDEFSVRFQMVGLEEVNAALERVNGVRILILDACRNNPLADRLQKTIVGASRSAATTRGLARIDKTQGMVVAYATAADDVANDGQGRNSPFTTALLKRLREPGLEIGIMFLRVASDVYSRTGGRQRPEHTVSLLSEYYLNQNDRVAWEHTDQDDVAALRDFVSKYPSSPLAIGARNRVDLLERYARERGERRGVLMLSDGRREEQARIAAQEEQERREEQARLAAQDEQKRQEEQARISAVPADAPVTKVPSASATPPGPTIHPPATKANLPEQIRRAQAELKRLGCFEGELDDKMDTTEKAIKAFWKRSNKPVAEINITDEFIADLQRQHDDFCTPSKPPAVANHPSTRKPATAVSQPAPQREAQPRPAPPARVTTETRLPPEPPASDAPKPRSTGVGF
jgi:uncharacterized caspase-like protein